MKFQKTIAYISICALLAGTAVHQGYYRSRADELGDAEQERQRLKERKEETEKELSALEDEKDDLLVSIEKLDKKMENVSERLDEVNENYTTASTELDELTEALTLAEQDEASQYETMKKRIKYMYENGNQGYLDIILASKSVGDFLNRVEYVNKITAYDNKMLKEYKNTKNEVTEKKEAAQEKKNQLEILQEEVELEQDNLQSLSEKKQKKLEDYTTSIDEKSDEAQAYQEEIEKKEKEIDKLLLEQAKDNGFSGERVEGGFIWPLAVSGTITSHFGRRSAPTAGASTYHKGIDIAAPAGTAIYAAADGTVTTATYSSSAGNYVMINHGNGLYTVYMHASRLYCSVGDKVSQGDRIAAVGSTGVSTGAHLHFGVISNGNYVNPEDYVSR